VPFDLFNRIKFELWCFKVYLVNMLNMMDFGVVNEKQKY
jgi:hypothetical protein